MSLFGGIVSREEDVSYIDHCFRMSTVDYDTVPIVERELHRPPLSQVVDVLSRGLLSTFEDVQVEEVASPDLTQPPFGLAVPGICGSPKLIELGGAPYLLPLVRRDKLYDAAALVRRLAGAGWLGGAGAGPWPYLGVNCEGIMNMSVQKDGVRQGSRVVSVEPRGAPKGSAGYRVSALPPEETRSAVLGNYLMSRGQPGQVLKVVASKRVGEANFITAIRETLQKHYGDKVVGLGGAFLLRSGAARLHVMPDFSRSEIHTDQQVDDWLHFFTVPAPIVFLGTLVTGDLDLDLRVQHFHGWGEHGVGGHYHFDTTPPAAQYEGYFVVAETVVRVDAPPITHLVGRD